MQAQSTCVVLCHEDDSVMDALATVAAPALAADFVRSVERLEELQVRRRSA